MFENFGFVFGEIGEYLAVELNIGLEKLIDEFRISGSVVSGGGVNLDRPESAHCAFLFLSVGELKTPSVKQCFFGLAVFGFAGPQKTLGLLEQPFASFVLDCSSFNSWHICYNLRVLDMKPEIFRAYHVSDLSGLANFFVKTSASRSP